MTANDRRAQRREDRIGVLFCRLMDEAHVLHESGAREVAWRPAEMAEKIGVAKITAQRYIKELAERGWLTITPMPAGDPRSEYMTPRRAVQLLTIHPNATLMLPMPRKPINFTGEGVTVSGHGTLKPSGRPATTRKRSIGNATSEREAE